MIDFNDLIKDIKKAIYNNQEIFNSLPPFTYDDITYYDSEQDIDYLQKQIDLSNISLELSEKNLFRESFILLRTCFEHIEFGFLYVNGEKCEIYNETKIIPKDNSNPIARDNTFKLWIKNRREWGRHKTKGLESYENIKQIFKIENTNDHIATTFLQNKVYASNDFDKTGYWETPFKTIYRSYNPFYKHIPKELMENNNIKSDSYNIDSDIRISTKFYEQILSSGGLIKNLQLNNLIDEVIKKRFNVHYNFLSIFVHPNKKSEQILKMNTNILNLLVYIYSLKLQEICIFIYLNRLHTLYSEKEVDISKIEELMRNTKNNSSITNNFLQFIFDDPLISEYYNNPFEELSKNIIKVSFVQKVLK